MDVLFRLHRPMKVRKGTLSDAHDTDRNRVCGTCRGDVHTTGLPYALWPCETAKAIGVHWWAPSEINGS